MNRLLPLIGDHRRFVRDHEAEYYQYLPLLREGSRPQADWTWWKFTDHHQAMNNLGIVHSCFRNAPVDSIFRGCNGLWRVKTKDAQGRFHQPLIFSDTHRLAVRTYLDWSTEARRTENERLILIRRYRHSLRMLKRFIELDRLLTGP